MTRPTPSVTSGATRAAPRRPGASWGVLVAVAVAAGIAVVDGYLTPRSVTVLGLLATAPFIAATCSTVTGTVTAGIIAAGAAGLMGDYDHALWSRDLLVVLSGVAAATVVATATAGVKGRRLRQLHHTRVIADVVQQTLLRPVPPQVAGVDIAAHYSSATRGAQVGGDIYDVLATPFGLRVFVGDVRGKGLPALHLASAALGAFREWAYQSPNLVELAQRLDASVSRHAGVEDFVTAVLVEFGDGTAEIVNCGHPAPIQLSAEGATALEPEQTSLPLGVGITAMPQRIRFATYDRLLLFTDGVSDARRRRKFFDVVGEAAALRDNDIDELVRRLHRRLVRFTRRRLDDDVAILLLERRPPADGGDRLSVFDDNRLDPIAAESP